MEKGFQKRNLRLVVVYSLCIGVVYKLHHGVKVLRTAELERELEI